MYGAVLQQGFFFNHDFLVIKRRKKKTKIKRIKGKMQVGKSMTLIVYQNIWSDES
jgi:hypothetical protein